MNALQMWILAGVVFAAGITCLVWYLAPAHAELGDVMARLRPGFSGSGRTESPTADAVGGTLTDKVGRWSQQHLPAAVLRGASPQDLALLNKPAHAFYGEKVLHVVGVLVAVPLISVVWSSVVRVPIYVPTFATLLLAGLIWFVPNMSLREEASKARAEFSRALASYIDLVALERKAGQGGTRQALENAARLGDSWPFRKLSEALARSGFAGMQPADALHDLARQLALPDLDDLADVMRLAGTEGVQVYDALRARAGAMRQAKLTTDLAQSNAIGERMTIPTTLMGLSIMLIVLAAVMLNLIAHT